MSNMAALPIIHIIGLPGAGKSTLVKRLSWRLKLPVYRIGEYRSKFPVTFLGEADAWLNLFKHLSGQKWRNCILETIGLNRRELFLKAVVPPFGLMTIKLAAQRKVLYARIGKKKKSQQGGEWLFSSTYRNKHEFVKKLFKEFKEIPAEIKIDTTKLTSQQVYKTALEKLKEYAELN